MEDSESVAAPTETVTETQPPADDVTTDGGDDGDPTTPTPAPPPPEDRTKFDWERDTPKVINKYFAQPRVLIQHQLESFNNAVETVIPSIISHNSPIQVYGNWDETEHRFLTMYQIEFKDSYMCRPLVRDDHETIKPLFPQEARLRNLTYAAPIFVDLEHQMFKIKADATMDRVGEVQYERKVPLCNFPVMLCSNYCHLTDTDAQDMAELGENRLDLGGYFIINGNEKVIIPQERPAENKVLCFKRKSELDIVEIKSTIDQRFNPVNNISIALSIAKEGESDRILTVSTKHFKNVNLFIVFRALGIETDQEIFQMILGQSFEPAATAAAAAAQPSDEDLNLLLPTAFEVFNEPRRFGTAMRKVTFRVTTQIQALKYLSEQMRDKMNPNYVEQQVKKITIGTDAESKQMAIENYYLKHVRETLARDFCRTWVATTTRKRSSSGT